MFTRGNASEERTEIISNAMGKGLSLIRLNDCAVEYETPPFERQALREELIQVNHAWRKGDIATFYVGKSQGKKDHATINLEKGEWIEYEYENLRIMIKVNGDRIYNVPSINTIEKDRPVIPTVSRRYEKRDLIDLWTSNNQGYKITGAHIVKTLLEYVLEKKELSAAVHALAKEFSIPQKQIENDCSESFQIIKDILERERDYEGKRSL